MEKRTIGGAIFTWCLGLLGLCGIHRMYTGKVWTGLVWLFTFGLFGIGQLIDLFLLSSMVRNINENNPNMVETRKENVLGPFGKFVVIVGLIFTAVAILATLNTDRNCLKNAKENGLGNGSSVVFCQQQAVNILKNNP